MATKRKHAAMDRLVKAFDFGTTFSGVAYAWCSDSESSDSIEVVTTWPGGNNVTSKKVPTRIAYGNKGPMQTIKWGYKLKSTDDCLKYFKLLLQTCHNFPEESYPTELKIALKRLGKTAEEVATDYFRQLLQASNDDLSKRFDKDLPGNIPTTYVLTVPAIWTDAAKDTTKRIARDAGLTADLCLITEPEAAAIWVLTQRLDFHTGVGDCFTVCDAGGGTVDLITYEVVSRNPLKFRKVVPGTGGLCGSTAIDLYFQQHVKGRITPDEWLHIRHMHPQIWATALAHFEDQVKRRFDMDPDCDDDDEDSDYYVPMSSVKATTTNDIDEGHMVLKKHQVAEIFDGPLNEIYKLIKGQIVAAGQAGKLPRAVILVGGFGDSPYLYRKILESLNQDSDLASGPKVGVLQSSDAWTAVVRGAVLSALPSKAEVVSRKSPYHYGVKCAPLFDPSQHLLTDRFWDDLGEMYRADNQMDWFIYKGQTMETNEPIPLDFIRNTKGSLKDLASTLYYCEAEVAPTRYEPLKVVHLCHCTVSRHRVPESKWKARENAQGVRYRQITYDLTLKKSSAMLEFAIRIDGRIYNSVQANFGNSG